MSAVHIELNEICVKRFFWALLHVETVTYETQNFTYYEGKYTEGYCRKAFDILREADRKLCNHIEYLTKKEVSKIDKGGVVWFVDGSKMRIV